MRRILLTLPFTLAAAPTFALDALSCAYDDGTYFSECRLAPQELHAAEAYGEADFTVSYDFACGPSDPGAEIKIGVVYGAPELPLGDQPLRKLKLGERGSVTVTSRHPVRLIDLTPGVTRNVLFDRGCKLEIGTTTTFPSLGTLAGWRVEATEKAEVVLDMLDAYLSVKGLVGILAFDVSELKVLKGGIAEMIEARLAVVDLSLEQVVDATGKLKPAEQMPDGWDLVVETYPDIEKLFYLWGYSDAIIAGRPSPYAPTAVQEAGNTSHDAIVRHFRQRLMKHYNRGVAMLARAQQYRQTAQAELDAAMTAVERELGVTRPTP